MEKFVPFLLIAAGLFSLVCAVMNWDWFMNHRKAKFMVNLIGRTGARIFYGLLGVFICGMGAVLAVKGLPAN
jgi:small neutral amino acid transporter SnatA (MarC family)